MKTIKSVIRFSLACLIGRSKGVLVTAGPRLDIRHAHGAV